MLGQLRSKARYHARLPKTRRLFENWLCSNNTGGPPSDALSSNEESYRLETQWPKDEFVNDAQRNQESIVCMRSNRLKPCD